MPKNFGAITDPKDIPTKEYVDGAVTANPTLSGGEGDLTALQVGSVKYKVASGLSPYTSTPAMDGTGSAGSSADYARGDHVHPTQIIPITKYDYSQLSPAQKAEDKAYFIIDDDEETLVFDDFPIAGSSNPVKSSGIKSAISAADVFDDSTAAHQGAGYKNSVFRGKNLGAFNSTYAAAIADGNFVGMFLGDYFQSSFVRRNQSGGAIDTVTVNWRIWGFDWFLHKGDTELTTHHAVILPDQNLGTIRMNSTDTTAGGYAGTQLRSSGRTTIQNQIVSVFTIGSTDYVLTYKDLLSKAVTSGQSSSWDWYDCKVEVPSDVMLTGAKHWGTGYDVGCHSILPLAAITQQFVCTRVSYWLRSVLSDSKFSLLGDNGHVTDWGPASHSEIWLRPFFLLS